MFIWGRSLAIHLSIDAYVLTTMGGVIVYGKMNFSVAKWENQAKYKADLEVIVGHATYKLRIAK
ncbi:MAG: hypothetical protein CMQ74_00690 [Gammaproteobacteria bacterium]|nr:hypothetical protein [Gammaproteobacteria bacterium]